jgi:CRISPR-associated protein Csd1
MLHRLVEYADSHNVGGQAGVGSKRIRFLLLFSPTGEFLSIHDYGQSGEEFKCVPDIQLQGDDPKRHFLADTLEFLALYPPPENPDELLCAKAELKKKWLSLLETLKDKIDFDGIKSQSDRIFTLLDSGQYLRLREKNAKKQWFDLLKRKGRGRREVIKEFTRSNGVVDAVFNHPEFKRISKHQFCLRLMSESSEYFLPLKPIARAMINADVLYKIHTELNTKKPAAKPSNNATFAIQEGDNLRILVKEEGWHDWWLSKFSELDDNIASIAGRCLLSGDNTNPILKHPKIKGLGSVGGNATTSLISYNKDSMASYGFSQGENAAVSVESAVKYSSAINQLLNTQHHRLAGTEIVYWYTKDLPLDEDLFHTAFDGLGEFEEDDDIEQNNDQLATQAHIDARKFLQSVAKGERRDLHNVEYCALTLQGNQGRAVAQNWMEGRFVDLAGNIDRWFSDLEITPLSGMGVAKPPKMETVITCLLKERKPKQKYEDWVKPASNFRDAMWHAAVGGRFLLPENAIRLILQRVRESMLTDEWENTIGMKGEQLRMRRARLYARLGLIKAYLIRNHNQEVDMVGTEKTKNSVYWLGTLFAELANLQREAHKTEGKDNVGSTIVDRFYTTASTCPKLVHGRLIAQSQHHLRKLENKNSTAAYAINKKIAEINDEIDFGQVPDMLPLPEQSWFALGYYQQIAKNNREKAEAIANKKIKENSTEGGKNE